MAKTIKTNELPVVNDLTGAKVIGLDAAGNDAQFPLDKITRSVQGIATPSTVLSGARFAGETWQADTASYGSTFPNFGNLSVPTKVGSQFVSNARFVWSGGTWVLQRELVDSPSMTGYLPAASIVNDLTTGGISNPLSAEQGKALAQAMLDSRDAVISFSDTVTALVTGSTGYKLKPNVALSNDSFEVQSGGNIVAKKDLYCQIVARTDWTMTNTTVGITRAQFKINDAVYMYDLSKPTGAALNTNKMKTPVIFLAKGSFISYDVWQNSTQPADATTHIQLIEIANSGLYLAGRNTSVAAVIGAETSTVFETTDFGGLDITNNGTELVFNKGGVFELSGFIDYTYPTSTNPTPLYALITLNGASRLFDKTTKPTGTDWTTQISGTLKINAGDIVSLKYNVGTGTPSVSVKRSKLGIKAVTGNVLENSSNQTVSVINTDYPLTFNTVISGENKLTGYSGRTSISLLINTSNSPASASNVDLKILKNGASIGVYRKSAINNQTFSFSKIENLTPSDVISFQVNAGYLAVIAYATVALTQVPLISSSKLDAITQKSNGLEAKINDLIGTETDVALAAFSKQSLQGSPFSYMDYTNKIKLGATLQLGAAGQPDAGMIESQFPWFESSLGLFVSIFTQYSSTSDTTAIASIGWATSPDLVTWTKKGTFFTPKGGLVGTRMEMGTTGPVMAIDPVKGKYHLFYIGLTESGYENGTKTLCRADGNSLLDFINGTAVRNQNPVISVVPLSDPAPQVLPITAWRAVDVYKPWFVFKDGLWYCFFNAGGIVPGNNTVKERIGYATATALDGAWTVNDANSPLLPDPTSSGKVIGGDPSIIEIGDYYIMAYFTQLNADEAHDDWAYTLKKDFPLGWKIGGKALDRGVAGSIDSKFAHKPVLFKANNKVYHFYTAVNSVDKRLPAVAVSK